MFEFFKKDKKQDEINKVLEQKRERDNKQRIAKGLAPFATVDEMISDALERKRIETNEQRISKGLKPFTTVDEMIAGDMRDLTKEERDEILASYSKKNKNRNDER